MINEILKSIESKLNDDSEIMATSDEKTLKVFLEIRKDLALRLIKAMRKAVEQRDARPMTDSQWLAGGTARMNAELVSIIRDGEMPYLK